MQPTVKLDGFKDLERALVDLERITGKTTAGKAVLLRTGKKAMKPLEQRMVDLAPKDTGKFAAKITTKKTRAKRISGNRFARQSGVEVMTGPTGRPEGGIGAYKEFGTVHEPAEPFARPAADQELPKVPKRVGATMAVEIDKTTARARKKAAKKG